MIFFYFFFFIIQLMIPSEMRYIVQLLVAIIARHLCSNFMLFAFISWREACVYCSSRRKKRTRYYRYYYFSRIKILEFNLFYFFQPKVRWIPGEHRLPGGGFPMPPAAADFCQNLPPPTCFHGPFVIVNRLVEVFQKCNLPEEFQGKILSVL